MNSLYNIGIYLADFHLKIIGFFNPKIKLGIVGRSKTFDVLQKNVNPQDDTIWFHCASLGEYEQGLPVFEAIRNTYKTHKIVLTFFSPSGYEIRKNTAIVDVVVYLPLDTKRNAKRFIKAVNPKLVVFVKYDIWPNVLSEVKKAGIRAILISALFRKSQSYFKFYGAMMRNALSAFEHIFVQNINSKKLLNSIHFENVTVAGDTRFDRVSNQLLQNNTLDFIDDFKQNKTCIVIGSSWAEDEELCIQFINNYASKDVKYIIAPHNIKTHQIKNLASKLHQKTVLFSEKEGKDLASFSVFIVDTIGLLSKIYNYADIAYVGGAMGKTGLHNILEPAVFGIPILIGSNYEKFPEAFQMIEQGGLISIKNYNEFQNSLITLIENKTKTNAMGKLNSNFINSNKGAVNTIVNHLNT